MLKYDAKVFETKCPENCPQFKSGQRSNCTDCPMHSKCPLQSKATSVDVSNYKNNNPHP